MQKEMYRRNSKSASLVTSCHYNLAEIFIPSGIVSMQNSLEYRFTFRQRPASNALPLFIGVMFGDFENLMEPLTRVLASRVFNSTSNNNIVDIGQMLFAIIVPLTAAIIAKPSWR